MKLLLDACSERQASGQSTETVSAPSSPTAKTDSGQAQQSADNEPIVNIPQERSEDTPNEVNTQEVATPKIGSEERDEPVLHIDASAEHTDTTEQTE